MSKNPYEIRLELLKMGKEMLDQQWQIAQQMSWQAFEKALETNQDLFKEVDKYIPKMFTVDEMMEQAEKLQEFIKRK